MILLAGKDVFWISREYARRSTGLNLRTEFRTMGNYRTTIGIVGASRIGRRLLELLRPFDFDVLVYDPFLSPEEAEKLGARACELEELVRSSSIVSLHAPAIPQTHHLIDQQLVSLMPDGAALINTARPSLVDQDALITRLRSGRIRAILDVTDPGELPEDHELRSLTNVYLTPHLAGSQGNELLRVGQSALEEALRLSSGTPLRHEVSLADLARMA
ncbi:MAG TPA: hydroxyacid dehydrogenase [Pseudolysinimonas sp.]|nr:hydroxyacid dehydrogenase [Pseudolysinimonas sp.]